MKINKDKAALKLPLQLVMLFPFMLVIIGTVGVVGYIDYVNGQKAVNDVAHRLRNEVSAHIEEHLHDFLLVPIQVNQFNATSMGQGWMDPQNTRELQNFFLEQVKIQKTITSIYFGNTDGGIVGSGREGVGDSFYVYNTEDLRAGTFNKYSISRDGETGELLTTIPNFDTRTRPWYIGACQKGTTTWSDIYILFTGQDMAISVSSPVFDEHHNFQGVVSVDIFLSQISKFLETLKISGSEQSFIMERTGLLVASSTGEKPFIEKDGKMERLDVRNSRSPVMKYSAEFLSDRFGENFEIIQDEQLELEINGEIYFLNVSPVYEPYGINWLSIVVIPESDFMAEIIAQDRFTVLITLLAVGMGILASVFISRKISSRISSLNKSTRAFARGETIGMDSAGSEISEIHELTESFIAMERQLHRTLEDLKSEVGERKEIERELRESERLFRAIFEQAAVGVAQVETPSGRFVRVNQKYCDILGYSQAELEQMKFQDISHPEDLSADLANVELLKTGAINEFSMEKRYFGKSGGTIWVSLSASPMWAAGETPNYHIAIVQEITARKQTEEQLSLQGSVLEVSANAIVIANREGLIEWANPAFTKLTGFVFPDELFGKSPRDVVRSGVHDLHFYKELWDTILSGNVWRGELVNRRKDGTLYDEEMTITPLKKDDGEISYFIAIKQDITERKRTESAIYKRVLELETINRISLDLRSVSKQEDMLSIIMDEVLAILNTAHGSIELHNKTTNMLESVIMRGWATRIREGSQAIFEGIAGRVFTSGGIYVTREFASDPVTLESSRSQIPVGWGGACLPIRTSQLCLGVMMVSVPSERELDENEIRLLSILSEMTGAALQRMQLHAQTVHRLEQLNALRSVDQAISSSRDIHLTLNILLTHTISQLNMDAAAVLLLHPGSNQLELAASRGFHMLRFESVNLRNSIAWRAIQENQLIMTLDTTSPALGAYPQFEELWKGEGFACYWCVPLSIKGDVKGVMEVYSRHNFTPDQEWIEFLEALAGQAAISIDSTQLFENLQRSNLELSMAYDATIEGWSRAMDLRDHETEGHTQRVTDLTLKLARFMQINESQLTAIRRGALLHDIGKMGVPDAILLKEGKLTDEEWVLMRKHPQLAHDMLTPIAYLRDALVIPYCHHEKWDGTGYPQGLAGEQIPLVARIFTVIDVWDALTTDRPYRKKWTKTKALQYIKDQSGRHFDPRVVSAFLKNIQKT